MEVTHATGHGGGPRGRPSSSHGLRPELSRRGSTPTDPKPSAHRGAQGPAAPPSSHRISPRPGRIPSRPTSTRDDESVVARKNPKVENGPFDRPRWPGRDFSRSAGHPTKISPIGGRSSGTASEVRWAATNRSPGQRPNLDHWRSPGITGQTARIGLITRRSRVQIPPPPPRPLVRRAPRAGLQASDQRFLVLVPVGGAGFSGVFLGALSRLHRACHGRVARRVRPLSCQFAAGFSSELMVPSAAHGMRTQRPDQPIFGRFPEISL